MRKSLQGILVAGLMTIGLSNIATNTSAQSHIDWINPDIPHIEQRGFSLGVNVGLADMWGDVGTYNIIDRYNNKIVKDDIWKNIRGMGGMYLRYSRVPGVAFRWGFNYGEVYASDEWNYDQAMKAPTVRSDPYQRYLRNLDAKTSIWESNLMFEFAPLRALSNWEFSRLAKMKFQPYILMGVSGFYFNPKGTYTNLENQSETWVDLRPLRTEGQGFVGSTNKYPSTYSVFSYAALAGVGVKWDMGRGLALGVEYQLRYTFTDYLDDVSGKYIDRNHADIAFYNDPNKKELNRRMSDKSREVIPGYEHTKGTLRGDATNNDMFSTISVTFMWKVRWRSIPWWRTYQ